MSSLKKQIPNLLTSLRLFISPLIFWLIIRGDSYWALLLILIGAITDVLDGISARRLKASSSFGYLFEHFVDKIYLIPIVYIVFRNLDFFLAVTIIALEIGTIVLSTILNKKASAIWPNVWGKLSYGFLIASSCLSLLEIQELTAFSLLLGNVTLGIAIGFRLISLTVFFKTRRTI